MSPPRLLPIGIVLSALWTCQEAPEGTFARADAAYDTIADVGGMDERNPLFIYQSPLFPQLVGGTKVLFADGRGGRLVAVDMLSGEGWEVVDGGGEGPGEFGGFVPWFGESNGIIYTASQAGQAATRSLEGLLLEAQSYNPFIHDGRGFPSPVGLLDSGVLVTYFQEWPTDTATVTEVQQGFRAYSPRDGLLWDYTDLSRVVRRSERRSANSIGSVEVSGGGIGGDARHGTVAIVQDGEPWLLVLRADGSRRHRIELPFPARRAFVDGNERIWVGVRTPEGEGGHYLVFDRDGAPVMRLQARSLMDARGDYLLTIRRDEFDAMHLLLLKRIP